MKNVNKSKKQRKYCKYPVDHEILYGSFIDYAFTQCENNSINLHHIASPCDAAKHTLMETAHPTIQSKIRTFINIQIHFPY